MTQSIQDLLRSLAEARCPLKPEEVQKELKISTATAWRLIRQARRESLVQRVLIEPADPGGRARTAYELTEKGRKRYRAVWVERKKEAEAVLKQLNEIES